MPTSLPECSNILPPVAVENGRGVLPYIFSHALYLVTMAAFFVTDIVLPRGATAAIGYCLIPVLARRLGDRRLLIVVTGICTMLTWIGFLFEPPGAASWMSVFDRAMVTGVLWLTLVLVLREMKAEMVLEQQAHALQDAVDELHRSNTELENFASVVSHDLRGPLASIELAIKLLSMRPAIKSDTECSEWIASIVSEVTRMSDFVKTLLAYGRVGSRRVNLSDCDCESVLADIRQALREEIESTGAEITSDPLPVIRADPVLVTELFQNLIENAIKYRRSTPPQIHLSTTANPGGWLFSIRDNGIGMAPKDCAQAFDPFYRGAADECATGFGLGLATCKRIIDRHAGRIEAQSSAGDGSTFTFFIPAATPNCSVGR